MICLICGGALSITDTTCPGCGVVLDTVLKMYPSLPEGTLLDNGHYRIEYPLGRGGFALIYRATSTAFDEPVAIKEFFPQRAVREGPTGYISQKEAFQQDYQRFLDEGRILKGLRHPGIVRIRDLFEEHGTAYLVLDFVEGVTLRRELEISGNKLPVERVEKIVGDVVDVLEYMHHRDIYHLDIKPDNILLPPTGGIVLIDFGAAQRGKGISRKPQFDPIYAAVEVPTGKEVGPESDLFELAMMAYELLTGERHPPALEREFSPDGHWISQPLPLPWPPLLHRALRLSKEHRPGNVRTWWDSRKKLLGVSSKTPSTDMSSPALSLTPPDVEEEKISAVESFFSSAEVSLSRRRETLPIEESRPKDMQFAIWLLLCMIVVIALFAFVIR